jgi:OmpR-family two-component system manganese-sensing sensor histidine kinase
MFKNLRWHLLFSYLSVMAIILWLFGIGVYGFFSRSLYQQLDKKLLTLAQAATPSLADIKVKGSQHLDQVNEVPWRDLFNRDQQSLEWFNAQGKLLARKGVLELVNPPMVGSRTIQRQHSPKKIRTYTISVHTDGNQTNVPALEGYIRASQSSEEIELVRTQLLWGLGMGGMLAIAFVGVGGLWLTQKAFEPVEKSFKQLKQFTADASHELRSPLTAIKMSVDVMRNHPERIHPKDIKKLEAIASASVQINHLVEELLFLARMDAASSMPMEKMEVSLTQVLQEVTEHLAPTAESKNVYFNCELPPNISVLGNKMQLTRLFKNLLENAIYYTPKGGKVNISLAKNNRLATVRIQDTGIGIAPEHLPLIFDRFWRADQARSRREGGSGLGLSIAKAIVQWHGGKITVKSQANQGSCFQVRLPAITS